VTEAYRFNRHVWDVEVQYFPKQRKFVMAIYCLYTLASGLIKLSVLLFYRRLSTRVVSPVSRWVMRIMVFIIAGYTITFLIIPIVTCRPISAFWDQVNFSKRLRPGGYNYSCINEGADVVGNGIVSTVQDFIVASLPTILCRKLQIPRRQKIALYAIFAISYSTVAVGAMRTYTSYRIFFQTYDVTWVSSDTWLWSLLELHIGSMCANAPALKVFFKQVPKPEKFTRWISSFSSKSRSQGSRRPQHSTDTKATNDTASSRFSVWEKLSFWKRPVSKSTSGHVPSSHISKSAGSNGDVLEMRAHYDPECDKRDSTSRLFGPEYTEAIITSRIQHEDIELGNFSRAASAENDRHEIYALPPIQLPQRSWLKSVRSSSPV
jgi:hypothetical protein